MSIYSFLTNYLAENVTSEEGLAKLKEMVQNLSIQFAENPAAFDATEAMNQVSPVWTGSAASYDQPSTVYIGTGEGNDAYGWGLYGSSSEGVARSYASADVRRKSGLAVSHTYAYDLSDAAVTLPGGVSLHPRGASPMGERSEAEDIGLDVQFLFHEYFYQSDSGLYASRIVDGKVAGKYHEHTQALMLLYDIAPENLHKTLAGKLCSHQCGVSASLSSLYLIVNALEKVGIAAADIIKFVLPHYGPMLANNTGTLWETSAGADDFGYAGSLCHGWSALPIYLGKALILGIKNQAPGWQNVLIAPQACGMTFANGEVPTPYGKIEVSFTSDGSKIKTLKVRCPKAITCSIIAPDAVIETEYYQ